MRDRLPTTIDLPPLRGGRTIDDRLQRAELYDGVLARRIFACLIDWMVLFCLIVLGHLATCTTAVITFGTLTPLMIITVALLPIIYGTWTIGGRASATPGMRAMDLTVRNWQGQRPDFPQALLMTILFYATVVPTSGFVLLVALFDRRLRCLHDLLSGVVVVRRSFLDFRG